MHRSGWLATVLLLSVAALAGCTGTGDVTVEIARAVARTEVRETDDPALRDVVDIVEIAVAVRNGSDRQTELEGDKVVVLAADGTRLLDADVTGKVTLVAGGATELELRHEAPARKFAPDALPPPLEDQAKTVAVSVLVNGQPVERVAAMTSVSP